MYLLCIVYFSVLHKLPCLVYASLWKNLCNRNILQLETSAEKKINMSNRTTVATSIYWLEVVFELKNGICTAVLDILP